VGAPPVKSIHAMMAGAKLIIPQVESYKEKPIDYIDPAPKPFKVQIPLVE